LRVKLKLDENLGLLAARLLTEAGHDACTVPMQGLVAATDDEVIAACLHEGRALVTLDLDFANPRRFRPSSHAGIAVLRLPRKASAMDLQRVVKVLAAGLRTQEIPGKLWIVESTRIRIYQEDDEP
jgi:predicted nuclease of predicted toxin-antitoxin system